MKIVFHVPAKEILKGDVERVRRAVELSDGVELQINSDVLDCKTLKEICLYRKVCKDATITLHAPFMDLNPGATDRLALEVTRKRFRQLETVAVALEAELCVFHTGFHPRKTLAVYGDYLKRAVETFKELSSNFPCKICLETVFETEPRKPLLDIIEQVNSDNLGVCIDIGHLNLFSKLSPKDWIDALGEKIFEFHMHDNDSKDDLHIALGKGNAAKEEFLEFALSRDVVAVMEAKALEDQIESLKYILNFKESKNGDKNLSR